MEDDKKLYVLGEPGTEPFTTPAPEQAPAADTEQAGPEGAPAAEPEPTELTTEQKLGIMEHAVRDLYQRVNLLLGLIDALGSQVDVKLKTRQVSGGGLQFYWEKAGRIVLPTNMRNN